MTWHGRGSRDAGFGGAAAGVRSWLPAARIDQHRATPGLAQCSMRRARNDRPDLAVRSANRTSRSVSLSLSPVRGAARVTARSRSAGYGPPVCPAGAGSMG
jgi:hypothetical protein